MKKITIVAMKHSDGTRYSLEIAEARSGLAVLAGNPEELFLELVEELKEDKVSIFTKRWSRQMNTKRDIEVKNIFDRHVPERYASTLEEALSISAETLGCSRSDLRADAGNHCDWERPVEIVKLY